MILLIIIIAALVRVKEHFLWMNLKVSNLTISPMRLIVMGILLLISTPATDPLVTLSRWCQKKKKSTTQVQILIQVFCWKKVMKVWLDAVVHLRRKPMKLDRRHQQEHHTNSKKHRRLHRHRNPRHRGWYRPCSSRCSTARNNGETIKGRYMRRCSIIILLKIMLVLVVKQGWPAAILGLVAGNKTLIMMVSCGSRHAPCCTLSAGPKLHPS
jgi:hypothetical protein